MEALDLTTSRLKPRVTQRRPQACTECARRKLRCSKVIPCGACMDRGISHLCHREKVRLWNRKTNDLDTMVRSTRDCTPGDVGQRPDRVQKIFDPVSPSASCPLGPPTKEIKDMPIMDTTCPCANSAPTTPGSDNDQPPINQTAASRDRLSIPGSVSEQGLSPCLSSTSESGLVKGVAPNTAVTLEFLALGRQHVMRLGHDLAPESRTPLPIHPTNIADPIVTPAQAVWLVEYHERNISWMHNILHMATFREQCDRFLESGTPVSPLWLPLYYTVLSVSLQGLSTDPSICSY